MAIIGENVAARTQIQMRIEKMMRLIDVVDIWANPVPPDRKISPFISGTFVRDIKNPGYFYEKETAGLRIHHKDIRGLIENQIFGMDNTYRILVEDAIPAIDVYREMYGDEENAVIVANILMAHRRFHRRWGSFNATITRNSSDALALQRLVSGHLVEREGMAISVILRGKTANFHYLAGYGDRRMYTCEEFEGIIPYGYLIDYIHFALLKKDGRVVVPVAISDTGAIVVHVAEYFEDIYTALKKPNSERDKKNPT